MPRNLIASPPSEVEGPLPAIPIVISMVVIFSLRIAWILPANDAHGSLEVEAQQCALRNMDFTSARLYLSAAGVCDRPKYTSDETRTVVVGIPSGIKFRS